MDPWMLAFPFDDPQLAQRKYEFCRANSRWLGPFGEAEGFGAILVLFGLPCLPCRICLCFLFSPVGLKENLSLVERFYILWQGGRKQMEAKSGTLTGNHTSCATFIRNLEVSPISQGVQKEGHDCHGLNPEPNPRPL